MRSIEEWFTKDFFHSENKSFSIFYSQITIPANEEKEGLEEWIQRGENTIKKILFALDPKVRETLDNVEKYLVAEDETKDPKDWDLSPVCRMLTDLDSYIEENYKP